MQRVRMTPRTRCLLFAQHRLELFALQGGIYRLSDAGEIRHQ